MHWLLGSERKEMSQETEVRGVDPEQERQSERSAANVAASTLSNSQTQAVDALPSAQKAQVTPLYTSANALAHADSSEPQQVAAATTNILTSYYTAVLLQSRRSFNWALIAAGIGLVFFLAAVAFITILQSAEVATVSIIGGAITEVISGLNFYLYGKATQQLAEFHRSLEQTQRFLLANSIAETLGTEKDNTRADLVDTIAQAGSPSSQNQKSKTTAKDQESRPRGSYSGPRKTGEPRESSQQD